MMALFLVFVTAATGQNSYTCPRGKSSAEIQWSEARVVPSYDHRVFVKVVPNLRGDENESEVQLIDCATGDRQHLITLTRSADVHWRGDGRRLLVIDRPTADSGVVRLFRVVRSTHLSIASYNHLDAELRERVEKLIGRSSRMVFFRPRLESWLGIRLALEVSGATAPPGGGMMKSYCVKVVIDSQIGKIAQASRCEELAPGVGRAVGQHDRVASGPE
jgi:hypothetical protein